MATYADLVRDVLPHVSGCPDVAVERALKHAVAEFCKRALCYRKSGVESSVAGQGDYTVPVPGGYELVKVLDVKLDGTRLAIQQISDMHRSYDDWQSDAVFTSPQFAVVKDPSTIQIVAPPLNDGTDNIEVYMALTPDITLDTFSIELADEFTEAFAFGAASRLQMMAAKPWYNPQGAQYCRDMFLQEVDRGKRIGTMGYGKGTLRTKTYGP